MIEILRVRQQCQIDDDDSSEDVLLTSFLAAAKVMVADLLNRPVIWEETLPDEPEENSLLANPLIELACLMLVGHFFVNRESTTDESLKQVPMGVTMMLNPYRVINL